MARLYHPELEPPHNEYECPDDEGLLSVLTESGWLPAPEPEQTSPAHVPEPVRYEPVVAKSSKRGAKTSEPAEEPAT